MLENAGVGARSGTRPFLGLTFCQKNKKVRCSRSSSSAVSAASIAGPLASGAWRAQPTSPARASATAALAMARPRAFEPGAGSETIRHSELEAARRAGQPPGLAEVRVGRIAGRLVAVVVGVVVGIEQIEHLRGHRGALAAEL